MKSRPIDIIDCTGIWDVCRGSTWICESQYDQDMYRAGPPPPCPPPPPGHTPPPEPGVCQLNISTGYCQYQKGNEDDHGGLFTA